MTNFSRCDVEIRDIPGIPGYAVGRDGSVWSSRRLGSVPGVVQERRRLKLYSQKSGHLYVMLATGKHGRQICARVHRLVMLAFVGPRPEGVHVRHLDGNPKNNSLDNLAYGTRKENGADAVRHGTSCRGSKNAQAKINEDTVYMIRRDWDAGMTCKALGIKYGITGSAAHLIGKRKSWSWLPEKRFDAAVDAVLSPPQPGLFDRPIKEGE